MGILVLARHGQSIWNKENIFTGWTDVELSEEGRAEAFRLGEFLRDENLVFDNAYVSVLSRAINTLNIVLEILDQKDIPIIKDQALNERNYGDLQGKNKDEMISLVGEAQVALWRRSYTIRPPHGESLEDTYNRVIPFFLEHILFDVKNGRNVLVVAHGNTLRAVVKYLDRISDEDIVNLNIQTAVPLIYDMRNK